MDLELVGLLRDVSLSVPDRLAELAQRNPTSNVLLQNLGLSGLGVSKIHHFVQQFVDDDKVVADALLLEFLKVLGEDLDDLVHEKEYLGGIGVALGDGEHVEVIVFDVEILSMMKKVAREGVSKTGPMAAE